MKSSAAIPIKDEEAVSAAIGTVLLFAGVLSIIGVMMMTMIPVISELEGAVERGNMVAQMLDMSNEIDQLSSNGMPGDSSTSVLKGIEGRFKWQNQQGGVWISAAWQESSSLRLADALDLDRDMQIRYPSGEVSAVCFEDLRLGSGILSHFRIPAIEGRLLVSPDSGLAQSQGPLSIIMEQDGIQTHAKIADDETWSISLSGNGESWLHLNAPAQVLLLKGEGGTSLIPAQSINPASGEGRAWRLAIPAGNNTLTLVSQQTFTVDWKIGDNVGSEVVLERDSFMEEGATWTMTLNNSEDLIANIQSSTDARMLLAHNDDVGKSTAIGFTSWPSIFGNLYANTFQPPGNSGTLLITNQQNTSATIRWGNGAESIPPESTLAVQWPPQGTVSPQLIADDPVSLRWTFAQRNSSNATGLDMVVAIDSSRSSGHSLFDTSPEDGARYHPQVTGTTSNWTAEISNITTLSLHSQAITTVIIGQGQMRIDADDTHDSLRIYHESGDDGILSIQHDGKERCRKVGMRASGWISIELPWQALLSSTDLEAKTAWQDGSHPSSIKVELIGPWKDETTTTLSTAWAIHAPRLVYGFSSSIQGLEVAMRAGALVTNHPEVEPTVIKSPLDRNGPGPRFAISIPLLTPTSESQIGAGKFTVDLLLEQRLSLTSAEAHEVRRGWDGPYGRTLAAAVSRDLRSSEDWTAAPMRLDLLNDYKGWVPHPSMDSSETIYHTQGESIQFSLQLALVSCTMEGM